MNEKTKSVSLRPFAAVHVIVKKDKLNGNRIILGCSFRLWGDCEFITANHCIENIVADELFVLDLLEEDPFKENIPVTDIIRHPTADIAILKTVERDLSKYHKFLISKNDLSLGAPLHGFGYVSRLKDNSFRVVPAFSMRDYHFEEPNYHYQAIELSMPIPKGTSGAPIFSAWKPNPVIGVATGCAYSEIELRNITYYQDEKMIERERISEFTRFGIALSIKHVLPWIIENIPGNPIYG